eukprot:TRINITY_DN3749_c0_g1_i2.p1 TRINITY_DN3749_c0_g1~~TRINITY_DN3749_c0_g1_i2.p1  ORF type:complete len:244 (+),score=56.81 TRINITY_DN3749_c0_g1_i2:26-733(+)
MCEARPPVEGLSAPEEWKEYIPTKIAVAQTRYYRCHLHEALVIHNQPGEILELILMFAVDGVKIGDLVDAMDLSYQKYVHTWCVAEVIGIDVNKGSIQIHYTGWPTKYDLWVDSLSPHLLPVFTHTKHKTRIQPRHRPLDQEFFKLGYNAEQAAEAVERCGGVDLQNGLNAVIYLDYCRTKGIVPEPWEKPPSNEEGEQTAFEDDDEEGEEADDDNDDGGQQAAEPAEGDDGGDE